MLPVDDITFCSASHHASSTTKQKQKTSASEAASITKWSNYGDVDHQQNVKCGDQICHYYAKCQQTTENVSSTTTLLLSSSPGTSSSTTTIATMKKCQCQNNCSNGNLVFYLFIFLFFNCFLHLHLLNIYLH